MIQITCKGNSAICTRTERLTSGMVGLQCEFVFDEAWDGLAKTAVFQAGSEKRDVLLTGAICTAPWEVLKTAGYQLVIGVYGTNAEGTLLIPTVYAMCGGIASGADPSGDESTDPTLPVWGQIQGMIGNLANLETTSKDNLVSAINEAAQSGGGSGGASVELDTTLTHSGKAADAKAVGDALAEKQPKGDYLTQNELPDMTAYGTAEAQDVIDAGKQPALIQSGASVGQIAKIAAVDDSGKPTAWEAVDMPSGGGEMWELINEITIPDGAEETNALVINDDLNGNPFELKKALLFVFMPKYTDKSTIPNYSFSSLNGICTGPLAPAVYTKFIVPSDTQNRSMWWRVSVANNGLPYHEELAKTHISGSKRFIGGDGVIALFDEYIIDGTEPAKESITEIGTKNNLIYAGCYFALYGVRK